MKSPKQLMVLAVGLVIGGCAPLMTERPEEMDARHRLDRGLAALDAGAYPEAFDNLTWVYAHCPDREAGGQALLALAALELDARNDLARPRVGTELLARAIRDPGTPHWVRPIAETTFLTALALGAPHPGDADTHDDADHDDADLDHAPPPPAPPADTAITGADAAGATPGPRTRAPEPAYGCGAPVGNGSTRAGTMADRELPALPGPSMAALLTRAEARRDSLSMTTESLRRELTAARAELDATREELERIRRTLQP